MCVRVGYMYCILSPPYGSACAVTSPPWKFNKCVGEKISLLFPPKSASEVYRCLKKIKGWFLFIFLKMLWRLFMFEFVSLHKWFIAEGFNFMLVNLNEKVKSSTWLSWFFNITSQLLSQLYKLFYSYDTCSGDIRQRWEVKHHNTSYYDIIIIVVIIIVYCRWQYFDIQEDKLNQIIWIEMYLLALMAMYI